MDKPFPIDDQIKMLGSALRGQVIQPEHADYETARKIAHTNHDRRPAAVIRVANAADIAAVINFARATDLPLAIRSGGHSTIGASQCDGGLVIDMRGFRDIQIDAEAQTAWCGTGLTAGDVTRAVEQHGLIVGFGDASTVGIAGLTLGGGIGFLARKHGLTIDSLLAAEIVTAEGDILVVDADNHPDLFWALRGGGGNFGVVTRLKYQLHPLPAFTGGALILPATAEVIAGFAELAAAAPEELTTIVNVMPLPPLPFLPAELHGTLVTFAMIAFAGEAEAAQRALAPFRALATPIADLVKPGPYSSLYDFDPPLDLLPLVSLRSRFSQRFGIEEARRMLTALERSTAPVKIGQFRMFGGAFRRGNGDTAFAHRDAGAMLTFLALYVGDRGQIGTHEAWAAMAVESTLPDSRAAYVNFLAEEGEAGLHSAYPAATMTRLRAVKRRYDPENLFRLNQNIPPSAA